MTIAELKDLFENSYTTCVLYDKTFGDFFWEGQVHEIPSEFGIDNMPCSLYDATYETRQKHNVDYEIFCDGICWEASTNTILYYIDDKKVTRECFFDELDQEIVEDVKNFANEQLDKKPPYELFGNISYLASNILKNCDPEVYNNLLNKCREVLQSKKVHELERDHHIKVSKKLFKIEFKGREK